MRLILKKIREENELIVKLKGVCPDNKIPTGILLEGKEAMEGVMGCFSNAKKVDMHNERRPD
jgi:serine/threonine-protein phosphatase 2B catalytic subunit